MGWEAGVWDNQGRLQTVQYIFARGLGLKAQNPIRKEEQGQILEHVPGDAEGCPRAQFQEGPLVAGPCRR